jgi:hypothetical protein
VPRTTPTTMLPQCYIFTTTTTTIVF